MSIVVIPQSQSSPDCIFEIVLSTSTTVVGNDKCRFLPVQIYSNLLLDPGFLASNDILNQCNI